MPNKLTLAFMSAISVLSHWTPKAHVSNINLLLFWIRCACTQRRRLCSVMQALPEWQGQNTDGSLSKQGSQKWKQSLCKFLVSKGVKMQKTNLKAKGLANKHHLKASDHAWQAVGLGFAGFVGKNKCGAPKGARDRVQGAHVVATWRTAKESCWSPGALLYRGFERWRHAL